jgi:glycine hydroxymethyltransferase
LAAIFLAGSCASAFPVCAPFAARLRGGASQRPWRSIPLDDGEVAFFHTRRGAEGLSMTAADWKEVESVPMEREYPDPRLFTEGLAATDDAVASALRQEMTRQQDTIELIASENIVSRAVMEAQGSVLTNKYAEGYPAKRYYGGCEHADVVEDLAIDRVKELYGCEWANVQPHSGASANQAVMLALCTPGDTILGMSLASGGHLTHGAAPNLSGKWFNAVQYGVTRETGMIDYAEVEKLAREHKPKIIIAGGSAYSRIIDFERFRNIADEVGAIFWVDMAHFSGLVAGHAYPSPLPHAHVVTSTTHKTLRGPRGGIILSNDAELGKKINSAVFPGLQGGPLMHTIAAKAVAFGEALRPSFRDYSASVVSNAKAMSSALVKGGLDIVSGGTDSHVILVDLRPKGLTGKVVEAALHRAGITCNKNSVPYDPEKPFVTSGVRLGTPAITTRGMGPVESEIIGQLILRVVDGLAANGPDGNMEVEQQVRDEVKMMCQRFPIYSTGVPMD